MSITVGQVSGVIACVGIVLHLVSPLIAAIVFVSLLSSEHTAATWSVVNRQLQSTLWPVLLRADSTNTTHVARRVRLLAWLRTGMYALISVAAFVTPLGLTSVIELGRPSVVQFSYVDDASPFGFGTPVRYNRFSRLCGSLLYLNCPGSTYGGILTFSNDTGYGYGGVYNIPSTPNAIINSSIMPAYMDMFTSATAGTTLSGLFDIQYRVWSVSYDSTGKADGGRPFPIGTYRHLDTLVTRNEVVLIEGAIADMLNGGLGYRNHTVPTDIPYGAKWEEEVTWMQPVTECVDTNLTIQFFLDTELGEPENIHLVDNGGFANLVPEYPEGFWHDRQNPDLRARAYKAAWINNAMSAVFLNVTRPGELHQMNSSVGKIFGQGSKGSTMFTPALYTTQFSDINGGYLSLGSSFSSGPDAITSDNFTSAAVICQGWGGSDMANYTNTGVYCGYLYGAPQRSDGGDGSNDTLVFEPKKNYTQNLYVCATAIQQKIKTVEFMANSSTDLAQLRATNISDKIYPNNSSMPLWAIEHSNLTIDDVSPIWGMVADRFENTPGFDTVRAPQFWIPAKSSKWASSLGPVGDSLAQPRIFQDALYAIYSGSASSQDSQFSGANNMAMNRLWSQLSRSPGDAAKIINLVWTELAATSTVGIKAVLSDGSSSSSTSGGSGRIATPYAQKIGYTWAYAIPGFFVLLAVCIMLVCAFFFALTSRFSLRVLRQLLKQTATGRVATNLLYPGSADPGADTKQWAGTAGKTSLSFAAVEKERAAHGNVVAAAAAAAGPAQATVFPGVGQKGGEYILMQENPH